ncbi:MAG: trypsin-like peptidase domain-containing protein [Oscillospiraceae bacterium]|nr:trypsin-like peptidase domain-containing protein [Oscillospiraceae bacterium]
MDQNEFSEKKYDCEPENNTPCGAGEPPLVEASAQADAEAAEQPTPKPPVYPEPAIYHTQPPKKKHHNGAKFVALALACALIGGAAGAGGVLMTQGAPAAAQTATVMKAEPQASNVSVQSVAPGAALTSSQIYNTYSDAVVCITVQTQQGEGAGTGFFISDDGYILTCYHVVGDAQAISVTLNNTNSYEAKYIGGDEDQDVAVLKIEPTETLTTCVLGDSSALAVGDNVTVIGNALGTLANTLTTGVVSATDRAITMSDGTVMRLMQTDCTINSGNSGGPLFNTYGQVVGIVNSKYSSSGFGSSGASIEGIGFAIPMNDVSDILSDLMTHGYVTGKPYLGISVSTVSAIAAQQYQDMVVGAYVISVTDGSCAKTAGLQSGDIITQVDGKDITSSAELIDAKNTHKSGEEMTLTVYRAGNYITTKVTLDEEKPDAQQTGNSQSDNSQNGNSQNGNSQNGNSQNGGYGSFGFSFPFGYGSNW